MTKEKDMKKMTGEKKKRKAEKKRKAGRQIE